jgi:hypothetical protein
MAIVRLGAGDRSPAKGNAAVAKRAGAKLAKKAAKKGIVKHAAKKHAAKGVKEAAKKAAKASGKHRQPQDDELEQELARAFHHLQRAAALISLLEGDSGADLRQLLEHGIALYRRATETRSEDHIARCAAGLLRATEHLGMAGLYAARGDYRVTVDPPTPGQIQRHLEAVQNRLEGLEEPSREPGIRLVGIADELLHRAAQTGDPHLSFELTMAADGLCTALEEGI